MAAPTPQPPAKPRAPVKRPGANRPAPVVRKPRKPNWIYVAGCVILMGVFFTPWFSTPLGSVYGYEICYWVPRVLNALYAPAKIVLASNSIWALAFIGVFAFFGLGMELASLAKHKNHWWLRALTAISPILAVMFIFSVFMMASAEEIGLIAHYIGRSSGETQSTPSAGSPGRGDVLWALLKLSGWGLWLMLLAMLLCAVSVGVHPGRKKSAPKPTAVPPAGHGSGAPPA